MSPANTLQRTTLLWWGGQGETELFSKDLLYLIFSYVLRTTSVVALTNTLPLYKGEEGTGGLKTEAGGCKFFTISPMF